MVEGFSSGLSRSDLLALRIRQLQKKKEDINKAAAALKRARIQSKLQFERRFKKRLQRKIYDPGDLVLVRNSRIEASLAGMKTEPRYLGPYEVVRRTQRGTYILQELDGAQHAEPYAAFRILPYISRESPEFYELIEDSDNPASSSSSDESDSAEDSNVVSDNFDQQSEDSVLQSDDDPDDIISNAESPEEDSL